MVFSCSILLDLTDSMLGEQDIRHYVQDRNGNVVDSRYNIPFPLCQGGGGTNHDSGEYMEQTSCTNLCMMELTMVCRLLQTLQ